MGELQDRVLALEQLHREELLEQLREQVPDLVTSEAQRLIDEEVAKAKADPDPVDPKPASSQDPAPEA